jgi:hypothetical protein
MPKADGVDLSRKAIKAARTDLEDALELLKPSKSNREATPVFAEGGPVDVLSSDGEALSGFWPAAMGFQQSATYAIGAVTGSYSGITEQLGNAITLLTQALKNYDDGEAAGVERAKGLQI